MDETRSTAPDSKGALDSAHPTTLGAPLENLSKDYASTVDLSWSTGFSNRQAFMGWSLLGVCFLGIIWGSLPGNSWLPQDSQPWEYGVALGVSLVIRFLCGLIIYEYEGFQVAAALVANRKITPDLAKHTQTNIRSIQKQGALESMFGGRQLILVSTVLFPTVVEAAFYPLLPSFEASDGSYLSGLVKVTVKTFAFAVLICILAQVSSQMKAIGGPIAWMRRKSTKYVITSVGFAEKLGLIIPSRSMADKLVAHHDLDGRPGTVHEWANWWSERIAADLDDTKIPPPYLLPPDHGSHIMPHQLLNFLLSQQNSPLFYKEVVPSFMNASINGLDGEKASGYWTWMDQNTSGNFRSKLPDNYPFIWRTGADSLGHIPPHHMLMTLFASYLLILKNSASPDHEIGKLFSQFSEASFGDPDAFSDYWSSVRKFKIGNTTPLVST